jgi:hypothetical protein
VRAAYRVGGLVGGRDANLVFAIAAMLAGGVVADVGHIGFGRVRVRPVIDVATVRFTLGGNVGQVLLVGDLPS